MILLVPMPIDPATDEMIPLSQVARQFPHPGTGKARSLTSVIRWVIHGVKLRGGRVVKLEAFRIAKTWYTTPDAIREFSQQLTASEMPPAPTQPAGAKGEVPKLTKRQQRLREKALALKKLKLRALGL